MLKRRNETQVKENNINFGFIWDFFAVNFDFPPHHCPMNLAYQAIAGGTHSDIATYGNPKLLAYNGFIYFKTMQMCQLNQSNLILKLLYVHKLQFISNKLHFHAAHMTCFTNQFFFSRTETILFLKHHTTLFVEPAI